MRPDLFNIPFTDFPVKSYGFMMMVGFLTAVWLGMRRAERVKASPDMILNCGMVALFCGIAGARLFFVAHYWESSFAHLPNPVMAALDITAGGLEYLGGVIGAVLGMVVYFALYGRLFARSAPRPSLRLYLDLIAPLSIWGLALTRVGCFLNGCCWGGICADHAGQKGLPWAVAFPFNSPAHERQWMNRQVRVPAELITDEPGITQVTTLVPRPLLESPPDAYLRAIREYEDFNERYEAQKAGATPETLKALEAERARVKKAAREALGKSEPLLVATQYPSREDPTRRTTASELNSLAQQFRSVPVHPAQLYDTVNAILLSWLLWTIYAHRKRHGVVFGWMLLLYPWSRLPLEAIRVDNPHDAGGLTISQAFSLGMLVVGIIWMLVLYKMPLRSPLAVPWVEPQSA